MQRLDGKAQSVVAELQSVDDGALLAAAAGGASSAFSEIVRRYYQPVYRLSWRMTSGRAEAEDIAQDTFLKLWRNPGQVREGGALKGWLMRVASNAVIDRSRRRTDTPLDEAPEVTDPAAAADQGLDRRSAAQEIERRLAELPERQRLALALVYYEGMTNIDAAAVMETSIEAVESLLARARRALRSSLAGEWRQLLDGLNAATD